MFIFEALNQTKKIYLSLEQIYIDKGKPGGMYVKLLKIFSVDFLFKLILFVKDYLRNIMSIYNFEKSIKNNYHFANQDFRHLKVIIHTT